MHVWSCVVQCLGTAQTANGRCRSIRPVSTLSRSADAGYQSSADCRVRGWPTSVRGDMDIRKLAEGMRGKRGQNHDGSAPVLDISKSIDSEHRALLCLLLLTEAKPIHHGHWIRAALCRQVAILQGVGFSFCRCSTFAGSVHLGKPRVYVLGVM